MVNVSLEKAPLLLYCTAPALSQSVALAQWCPCCLPFPIQHPTRHLQYSMWVQLHLHPNIPRTTQSPHLATAHSTIPGLPGFQTTVEREGISPISTFSRSPWVYEGARVDCPEVPLHALYIGRVQSRKYLVGHFMSNHCHNPFLVADGREFRVKE